jgi:hypothetical protein
LKIHAEQLKCTWQKITAKKGRKYSAPPGKHEYRARKTHGISYQKTKRKFSHMKEQAGSEQCQAQEKLGLARNFFH